MYIIDRFEIALDAFGSQNMLRQSRNKINGFYDENQISFVIPLSSLSIG